jgi:hypothetical protein
MGEILNYARLAFLDLSKKEWFIRKEDKAESFGSR